ncbi:MAG: hypothetical protein RMJ37_01965 [Spirochaetia bacterium]|nr:hypothetical protein [Spirochaetota bacterium]MCX8096643.1 hypothetical protein [Spirochaetota bacterium]MDW8112090.1 hypothetical protein [Spirochaetia bacterium]
MVHYHTYSSWWPYYNDKDEIIISSILTQNTNWKNVVKSLNNIFQEVGSTSLDRVGELDYEVLKDIINPSGFSKSKAKTILEVARYINGYGGYRVFKNLMFSLIRRSKSFKEVIGIVDSYRNELMRVKGIGKETADSILLYSFEVPTFVIDNYTVRIINSLFSKSFRKDRDYEFLRGMFLDCIFGNLRLFLDLGSLVKAWNYWECSIGSVLERVVLVLKVLHAGFVEIGKMGLKSSNELIDFLCLKF